ncbi:hypothetical protein IWX49DRAFT_121638 [Phyllosticta citricarpa]
MRPLPFEGPFLDSLLDQAGRGNSAYQCARTWSPKQPLDFSFPWVSCVAQRDVHRTWRLGSFQRKGDNTNVTAQTAEVASSSLGEFWTLIFLFSFLPLLLLLLLLLLPSYLLPWRRMLGGCIAVRCCPITHILAIIFFSFHSLCVSLYYQLTAIAAAVMCAF